jgi:hypothetical protein
MTAIQLMLSAALICLSACATPPKLDAAKIRPFSEVIAGEYPGHNAAIAHYKKDRFELYYLAARHTSTMGEDTMNLVEQLFSQFQFNVVLIESIPYSSGESPKWFLEEAKKGRTNQRISGGESALAAILADEKKIPFFAGEPDHQDIYRGLKAKGYTDEDVIGFYTVRQIPQWVREGKNKSGLLKREIPPFAAHYCKIFSLLKCPQYSGIIKWYKTKLGHELTSNVSNEETAPFKDGKLLTQKMSAEVGVIRDHFTLNVIEQLLARYKRVAVIYGAGHFLTLENSFSSALGPPSFTVDVR